jgi:H+/gluconate symporter-like permease
VDLAAVLLSVPLSFGVAYLVADSVAVALARVRELQLWIAGGALLVAAGWGIVLLGRHRRSRG